MAEDGKERALSGVALAHLTEDGREHALSDHLREVGRLAGSNAGWFESAAFAELAGRWHDLGKYADDFQRMIRGANGFEVHLRDDESPEGAAVPGKRVDHSSAGAVLAANEGSSVLAFVIAGHHAGLANESELKVRLVNRAARLEDAIAGGAPLDLRSEKTPGTAPPWLRASRGQKKEDLARLRRNNELWIRMVFSALCDADFLDTERFFDASRSTQRENAITLEQLSLELDRFVSSVEARAAESEVNRVRREVRAACVKVAALPPGVFTLTVPTGGGKTLASMTFALEHARQHGRRRVIVAIPYTSIIEQNADVFRRAFGSELSGAVVEHHGAVDPRRETWQNRLSSENWDAPVIVTTTVQLFDSLFANRPGRCRKLHNLAHSVLILDEAQTLPPDLLTPILDVLQDLVDHYGLSIVVCTATQPALHRREKLKTGLVDPREIVPTQVNAFARLQRVTVRWPVDPEIATPWADLASELATQDDVLAIVHQRKDARTLCSLLDASLGHTETLHLSALMCPDHRTEVLASITRRKKAGEAVRAVSTQLVEAGVDVDFPVVYRALAGLDSMAQAAGRCNREGKLVGRLGELRVFRAETMPPPGVLQDAFWAAFSMLREDPALDLFDPKTHRSFFLRLYAKVQAGEDRKNIQEMREALRFKDVAEAFHLVDNDWAAPVVVPWGADTATLVAEVEKYGPSRARLRRLQRRMVSVPKSMRKDWLDGGRARWVADTIAVIDDTFQNAYDLRFGLDIDRVSEGIANAELLVVLVRSSRRNAMAAREAQSRRILVRVRGSLACFTRPETKVDRLSYEVMTPSAARGVIEAVLWKPAIRWRVHEIHVLAPVRWTSFRRNEVNQRATPRMQNLVIEDARTQRNTVALRDVDYGVAASFEMTDKAGPDDNVAKFEEMFQRRLHHGQRHHAPYLGHREHACDVEPVETIPAAIDQGVDRPLGWMFWDWDWNPRATKQIPLFFDARLHSGVLHIPDYDTVRALGKQAPP